ncbi:MAG TPA: prepilin-type N-terminal cleavage/methylation domain-containing protein [Polyangiaceae bacterium]
MGCPSSFEVETRRCYACVPVGSGSLRFGQRRPVERTLHGNVEASSMSRHLRPRSPRGFTLVELLVVVVIVGVLGSLGVASFRARVFGSKSTEAFAMVQSIRAAEERWKAENMRYLNVSTSGTWYPAKPSDRTKRAFFTSGTCVPDPAPTQDCRWKLLNPTIPGPVQFGYKVNAGAPSEAMTTLDADAAPTGWSGWAANGDHWYVIQAIADADGDGVYAKFVSSSIRGDVFHENDGE